LDNLAATLKAFTTGTPLALDLIGTLLCSDLYAVAALVGAVVVVIGNQLGFLPSAAAIVGAAICFCLRLLAIHRGWQLPSAHPEPDKD
jgi:uncharacterized membrane protein YeiH